MRHQCHLLRVYDYQAQSPGHYWLVDRLWPRGISKQRLEKVIWLKEAAPSAELRQWFHHHPEQWQLFCECYRDELAGSEAWRPLAATMAHSDITLLYASRDMQHNHAIVLQAFLTRATAHE